MEAILYINLIIILSYLFIYALAKSDKNIEVRKEKGNFIKSFFVDISRYIYIKLEKRKIFQKKEVLNNIKILNSGIKTDEIQRRYWINKILIMLIIFFGFNILSFISNFSKSNILLNGSLLKRPEYGAGVVLESLDVSIVPENHNIDLQEEHFFRDYNIRVDEQYYSDDLLKEKLDFAIKYLENVIKKDNLSLTEVKSDLFFPKIIPNTSIKAEWIVEDLSLIDNEGRIKNQTSWKTNQDTFVKVILKYDGHTLEHIFNISISPKILSEEEKISDLLKKELEKASEQTKYDSYYSLPNKIDSYNLIWEEKQDNKNYNIIILSLLILIVVWIYIDKELDNKIKGRRKQMMIDYPNIISKFTILIGAGMTVKLAWKKIVDDYEKKKLSDKDYIRYAYEEMRITYNEIMIGVAESNAYETFGRRVGILPYMKFSSLICQNLRRGNKGLIELLNYEAYTAFSERKEFAKIQSEEATTKLLLPILLIFGMVLAMILIPAFLSFNMI